MTKCRYCGGIFPEGDACTSAPVDTCERALAYHLNPIQVDNIQPPIPSRQYDWRACRRDYNEGDPIGYGPDWEAAIEDLLDQEAL